MKINIPRIISLLSVTQPQCYINTCTRDISYPVPNTKRGKFKGHHRNKKS